MTAIRPRAAPRLTIRRQVNHTSSPVVISTDYAGRAARASSDDSRPRATAITTCATSARTTDLANCQAARDRGQGRRRPFRLPRSDLRIGMPTSAAVGVRR